MDGRSDQFALAVMVFDILTKEKPFAGDTLPILLYKICRADPPSASELNTTLGIWVDPVLRKALAKNPDERYQSCSAFIAELRRALDERPGWMLPGKGFPGEDGTTTSGHQMSTTNRSNDALPTVGLTAVTSASAMPPPAPPPPPPPPPASFATTSNPSLAHSTSNPSVQMPLPPLQNPAYQSQSGMPQPAFGQTAAIPIRRPREDEKKPTNPLLIAVPIVAVLAIGGYFGYQKFSESKPPAVENPTDPPKPPDPKDQGKQTDATKKPVETKVTDSKPVVTKPVADPTAGANTKGPFEVRFSGTPAGANIVVDSDTSTACKSPCTIPLPKGRHVMTAALDGYRSTSRSFEVTGESAIPVDLVETLGILVVRSNPPGASIILNGQERPEKTPAELRIKPGTYQIVVVSQDGTRDPSTVTVRDGAPASFNVNFK
jgi:serine/threonine-protein kinase